MSTILIKGQKLVTIIATEKVLRAKSIFFDSLHSVLTFGIGLVNNIFMGSGRYAKGDTDISMHENS